MPHASSPVTRIKQAALDLGFDAVGVASVASLHRDSEGERFLQWIQAGKHGEMAYLARDPHRRLDPAAVHSGALSLVCVGQNYWYGDAEAPPGSGEIARYARGRDYHKVFSRKLRDLEERILQVLPGASTRRYVDTGPVLEKLWAERAGLGWRGKHTNLVSREFGSWLLLGEVLLDVELPFDAPQQDHCGTCADCVSACPTGAITGPYQLDATLCISYLTIEHRGAIPVELRPALGHRIFGCDDCLAVCPWNRFAKLSRESDYRPRTETLSPLLTELVGMDEDAFYRRFAGTPVTRAKREGLARNVCVALGNLGREATGELRQRMAEALQAAEKNDPSPLVREHAAWALRELNLGSG